MNIKILRVNLDPLTREVKRLADGLDLWLASQGILPPELEEETDEEAEASYRDENAQALAEYREGLKKGGPPEEEP